jgi:hypothetical protein
MQTVGPSTCHVGGIQTSSEDLRESIFPQGITAQCHLAIPSEKTPVFIEDTG